MPVPQEALQQALAERFEIESVLGSGGMATVFLANDLRHGRRVAIKVLRPEIAELLGNDRFLREIAIVSQLSHPNIVPLYDSGTAGGLVFFVMPYVEGQTLRAVLGERGSLSEAESSAIALEVADALQYAHTHGIIHRDIKPENVLLSSGHAIVADFGVARAANAAAGEFNTTGRMALGTPAYMSPEQAAGSTSLDGRSDIYSLGLVLYEMLVGGLPARAVTPGGPPASPPEASSGQATKKRPVSGQIQRVIARAISFDFRNRFDSAADFSAALRRARGSRISPRGRVVALCAIGAAVAGVILTPLLKKRGPEGGALAARRVVVAPLVNRTGSATLDQVGVIAADWITGGLQRTGIVEIVPTETAIDAHARLRRDSTSQAGRDPIAALATETGSGLVITGAYYLESGRLLMRVQISDALDGRLLDAPEDVSVPVDSPIAGIVELRNRVMGWFGLNYDERLQGHARVEEQPPTYEAYLAFSEGMASYIGTMNSEAVSQFLRAYQLDSSFTLALLYASIALTNIGDVAQADSVLHRIAPSRARLSEYHRAWLESRLAFVDGKNEANLSAIRRAAGLAPGSKAVYNQAVAAFQTGHLAEALDALQRLSPDRGPMHGFVAYWDLLGAVRHARGEYEQELELGKEATRRFPARLAGMFPTVRALAAKGRFADLRTALAGARTVPRDPVWGGYGALLSEAGQELLAHGHVSEATATLQAARDWYVRESAAESWPMAELAYRLGLWDTARALVSALRRTNAEFPEYSGLAALIEVRSGHHDAARAIADTLAAPRPYSFGAGTLYRARIAAILGDTAMSIDLVKQAFEEGKEYDLWLHRDPDLFPLHGSHSFRLLLGTRQ